MVVQVSKFVKKYLQIAASQKSSATADGIRTLLRVFYQNCYKVVAYDISDVSLEAIKIFKEILSLSQENSYCLKEEML